MKKWISLTIVLACLLMLYACAPKETSGQTDGDLDYVLANGKLVIGITEYEPMNYYDENGKLIGFDTEFAEAVCAKLGVEPEFQIIDWDTKEVELKGKTIDVIWNGLTVKEDRRENMDFSDAYLINEQVIVVRAADAGNYADKGSFSGKTLVAEKESAGEDAVTSDLAGADYTAVDSQAGALLEVKAGTADAAVIDSTMAYAMTGAGTDNAELTVLDIPLTDEEYAIGFRLGSSAVAQVNEIIAELAADGTLAALAAKYGLEDRLVK
ncbi:MAG: transporter substrate-binding domain-containing protein [Clostridiales Family XIII bacterium]|jgi:polar amino acid transport system substrate-binding protein|nr:transporter substrate-binding domain-containing protein [Clostridiales Family XIII bacterium]